MRRADGFARARAALALGALLAAFAAAAQSPPYKNAKLPVERRVADLLERMTLEEKVAQLQSVWLGKTEIFDAELHFDPAKARAKFPNGLGTFARPSDARGASASRCGFTRSRCTATPRCTPRCSRRRLPWRARGIPISSGA